MDEATIKQMIAELDSTTKKYKYLVEQIDTALNNSNLSIKKEVELWSLAVDAAKI